MSPARDHIRSFRKQIVIYSLIFICPLRLGHSYGTFPKNTSTPLSPAIGYRLLAFSYLLSDISVSDFGKKKHLAIIDVTTVKPLAVYRTCVRFLPFRFK